MKVKKKDGHSDSWVAKEADWGHSSKNEGRGDEAGVLLLYLLAGSLCGGLLKPIPADWANLDRSPGHCRADIQTQTTVHPFFTLHYVRKLVQAFVSSVGSLTRAFKKLQHTWRSSAHPKSPEDTSAHQTHGLQPPQNKLCAVGDCSSQSAAPQIWNTLPTIWGPPRTRLFEKNIHFPQPTNVLLF